MNDLEILQRLRRMVEFHWYDDLGTYFGAHPIDRILRWARRGKGPYASREEVCWALDRAIEREQARLKGTP